MERVLSEIKKYIDTCQNCNLYQSGVCGYIFRDRHDWPEGKPLFVEIFESMSYEEQVAYNTQYSHSPCETQLTEISFLNKIEDMLELANCYFVCESLTRLITRCFKLQQKVRAYDGNLVGALGNSVSKAIKRCLAYVDYESLMHGENIIRYIHESGLDYTRKEGLFTICQEAIAIPKIESAAIVHIGGISSTSAKLKYNPDTEDVDYPLADMKYIVDEPDFDIGDLPCQANPLSENDFSEEEVENGMIEIPEISQAIRDGYISSDGYLQVKRSEFVKYCVEKGFFKPYHKNDWLPINGMIKDGRGNEISADKYAQSYQDLQQDGKV